MKAIVFLKSQNTFTELCSEDKVITIMMIIWSYFRFTEENLFLWESSQLTFSSFNSFWCSDEQLSYFHRKECLMWISSTGTSDPYVKFKIGRKEVFRSKIIHKNLNPVWEEKACILVDHLREPLYIKVSYSIAFPLWNLTQKSLFNHYFSCLWRTFQQRLLLTSLIQDNVA